MKNITAHLEMEQRIKMKDSFVFYDKPRPRKHSTPLKKKTVFKSIKLDDSTSKKLDLLIDSFNRQKDKDKPKDKPLNDSTGIAKCIDLIYDYRDLFTQIDNGLIPIDKVNELFRYIIENHELEVNNKFLKLEYLCTNERPIIEDNLNIQNPLLESKSVNNDAINYNKIFQREQNKSAFIIYAIKHRIVEIERNYSHDYGKSLPLPLRLSPPKT